MSNLLNKSSLYDLKKRGESGDNLSAFSTADGPSLPSYNREAKYGNPTTSPFEASITDPIGGFTGEDHMVKLLKEGISSERIGPTNYLPDVAGTNTPSSFRPADFDLEGESLYPNFNNSFGVPGTTSTYQNAFPDPNAKF